MRLKFGNKVEPHYHIAPMLTLLHIYNLNEKHVKWSEAVLQFTSSNMRHTLH